MLVPALPAAVSLFGDVFKSNGLRTAQNAHRRAGHAIRILPGQAPVIAFCKRSHALKLARIEPVMSFNQPLALVVVSA